MNSATIAKRSYLFISILLAAQVIGWKYILIYVLYMYSIGLQKKTIYENWIIFRH